MDEQEIRLRKFAYYLTRCRSPEQAARHCGWTGDEWIPLMEEREVKRLTRRYQKLLPKENPGELARLGLEQLVFSSPELCDFDTEDASGPRLFQASEMKRQKGGTLEIKFWDKLKALEMLIGLDKQDREEKGNSTPPLWAALEQGARALKEKDEE